MSDKETLLKLDALIEFFRNYNSMLSEIEENFQREQRIPKAA